VFHFLQGTLDASSGTITSHIIRGVLPYILLIGLGLLLMVRFPEIVLWLPNRQNDCIAAGRASDKIDAPALDP